MKLLRLSTAAALFFACGVVSADTDLQPFRQIELSPGHQPRPTLITRTSNGDYIIAGSSDQDMHHPWAVRMEQPSGRKLWEYIDGGVSAWGTRAESAQSIDSVIDLPEGKTVLCGHRILPTGFTPFFVVLDKAGVIVRSGTLDDSPPRSFYMGIGCAKWGADIAVSSTIGRIDGRSSLFGRFDLDGNRSWEKQSDIYGYEDMIATGDGGFLLINTASAQNISSVVRLNSKAELVSRYSLPPKISKTAFVRSRQPDTNVKVAYAIDERSELVELDEEMQAAKSIRKIENFTVSRAVATSDGSTVLFGSVFHKGLLSAGPQAAIAILAPKGSTRVLYLDQKWIIDAIPTDNPREFAFVDNEYVNPEIKWVSLKWISLLGLNASTAR